MPTLARSEWQARTASQACFFVQAEDGIRDLTVTGVQTCALPIWTVLADVVQIPAVRVVKRVLVIFVGSAMDTIGAVAGGHLHLRAGRTGESVGVVGSDRSEERRVGEEGRFRWLPGHLKKKDRVTP